jgi:hypothetical protein
MVMVSTRECTEGFDVYVDEIQELKIGHWIKPYGGNWHCDKCDHEQGRKSNFCPNCGANMRGEE